MTLLKLVMMVVAGPLMAQTQAVPGPRPPAPDPRRTMAVPGPVLDARVVALLGTVAVSGCGGGIRCHTGYGTTEADGTQVLRGVAGSGCDSQGCRELTLIVLRRLGDGSEEKAAFLSLDAKGFLTERHYTQRYLSRGLVIREEPLALSHAEAGRLVQQEVHEWLARPKPRPWR